MAEVIDAIVAFVTARLDDDERIARECARTNGLNWSDGGEYGESVHDVDRGQTVVGDVYGYMPDPIRMFIARHDPARALREVDAKRRLLALHVGEDGGNGFWYCKTCGSGEPHEYPTAWPCATLKLLAAPYVDHPDYGRVMGS